MKQQPIPTRRPATRPRPKRCSSGCANWGPKSPKKPWATGGGCDSWILLDENWRGKEGDLPPVGPGRSRWEKWISACSWARSRCKLFWLLKLQGELESICFYELSQQHLKELTHLPKCRELKLCGALFTAQQWRAPGPLIAGDVESLAMYGASSTVITTAGQSGELLAGGEVTPRSCTASMTTVWPPWQGSSNLKQLSIDAGTITDAGLNTLAAMKHLESLQLMECPQSARSDFAGIVGLESLRKLDIDFGISAAARKTSPGSPAWSRSNARSVRLRPATRSRWPAWSI